MKRVVPLGLGLAGVALAEVYVVDPSIDQYKQKTDQSFYDMYQNPQSIIAQAMQGRNWFNFNAISTDQRLTNTRLDTLPLVTDMNATRGPGLSVMGKHTRWCYVYHRDGRAVMYSFDFGGDGLSRNQIVRVWGSYHYRYGWNGWYWGRASDSKVGIGWVSSGSRCVQTCGGQCVRARAKVTKLMLDTACRNAIAHETYIETRRSCWRCGKSICYGSWSNWYGVPEGRVEDIVSLMRGSWQGSVIWGYSGAY